VAEEIMNYQKLIAWAFNARQEPIPAFSDDELKRLTMPCAVFVGAKDIMIHSDETADRLSKLAPHTEVTVLADKGHALSGLADRIAGFLERNGTA
jgi:pimeloyl-ACP methyl ester carboxylesterase